MPSFCVRACVCVGGVGGSLSISFVVVVDGDQSLISSFIIVVVAEGK